MEWKSREVPVCTHKRIEIRLDLATEEFVLDMYGNDWVRVRAPTLLEAYKLIDTSEDHTATVVCHYRGYPVWLDLQTGEYILEGAFESEYRFKTLREATQDIDKNIDECLKEESNGGI